MANTASAIAFANRESRDLDADAAECAKARDHSEAARDESLASVAELRRALEDVGNEVEAQRAALYRAMGERGEEEYRVWLVGQRARNADTRASGEGARVAAARIENLLEERARGPVSVGMRCANALPRLRLEFKQTMRP